MFYITNKSTMLFVALALLFFVSSCGNATKILSRYDIPLSHHKLGYECMEAWGRDEGLSEIVADYLQTYSRNPDKYIAVKTGYEYGGGGYSFNYLGIVGREIIHLTATQSPSWVIAEHYEERQIIEAAESFFASIKTNIEIPDYFGKNNRTLRIHPTSTCDFVKLYDGVKAREFSLFNARNLKNNGKNSAGVMILNSFLSLELFNPAHVWENRLPYVFNMKLSKQERLVHFKGLELNLFPELSGIFD